jgi:hypothetical protein
MNDIQFDRQVHEWLRAGPSSASPAVLRAVAQHVHTHRPDGSLRSRWNRLVESVALPRPAPVAIQPILLVLLLAMAFATGAFAYASWQQYGFPAPVPSPSPTVAPSPSPPVGFICPPGTHPDEPGPADQARPPIDWTYVGKLVWDSAAGRLLFLPGGDRHAWTFDVCTNTWGEMTAPNPNWLRPPGEVVYDEDSDLTIAIGELNVAAYALSADRWTDMGYAPMRIAQAAYDVRTGRLLVRDELTGALWDYDVDTGEWLEIDQGELRPQTAGGCGFQLLDYDRALGRLVLFDQNCAPSGPLTWLFDSEAGEWLRPEVDTPDLRQFLGNDQMVYDSVNDLSVAYVGGRVAAYDASANEWQLLYDAQETGRFFRNLNGYAFDPVNGRLIVIGGSSEWPNDIVAFDVATRTWTELLAPTVTDHPTLSRLEE